MAKANIKNSGVICYISEKETLLLTLKIVDFMQKQKENQSKKIENQTPKRELVPELRTDNTSPKEKKMSVDISQEKGSALYKAYSRSDLIAVVSIGIITAVNTRPIIDHFTTSLVGNIVLTFPSIMITTTAARWGVKIYYNNLLRKDKQKN